MEWYDELEKIDQWYLGIINNWQTKLHGFAIRSGIGDLISNNTALIRETFDRSDWAYGCLEACFELLSYRKRWPDWMDRKIPRDKQCKTRLCSFLNKSKFYIAKWIYGEKVCDKITTKYRSQGDMTRDPYINAIACAVDMNRLQLVDTVSIPWYLWRPSTWRWHKYLKKPTDRNYRRYVKAELRWNWFWVPEFVVGLRRKRVETAVKRRSDLD